MVFITLYIVWDCVVVALIWTRRVPCDFSFSRSGVCENSLKRVTSKKALRLTFNFDSGREDERTENAGKSSKRGKAGAKRAQRKGRRQRQKWILYGELFRMVLVYGRCVCVVYCMRCMIEVPKLSYLWLHRKCEAAEVRGYVNYECRENGRRHYNETWLLQDEK